MGVVYRAHDEKLQREIAIKMMGGESDRPDLDRLRIIEEARAASGLSHPHICTVYETGEFQGQAYIAMEYVEGRALSEMIPPGGLPPEAVIRYGIQVADALSHAHRRGIIHRDLKTSNVVVDEDSRAKVLDFGLARRIALKTGAAVTRSSDLMPDGKLVGTLAYMAPEMLLHQTADERSDIWGLGVMLFEMASASRRSKAATNSRLRRASCVRPPTRCRHTSPPMLRAIIQRCIAKEPGQRYQHAGEARAALEAIQSDVIAPASTSGRLNVIRGRRTRVRCRSRSGAPARAIAIGVAVLTVVAVAAVLWLKRDTRSLWERVANGGQLTLVVASDDPLVDPSVSLDGKMLAYIALDKQRHERRVRPPLRGWSCPHHQRSRERDRRASRQTANASRLHGARARTIRPTFASSQRWAAMRLPRSRRRPIRDGRQAERSSRFSGRRYRAACSSSCPTSTDRTPAYSSNRTAHFPSCAIRRGRPTAGRLRSCAASGGVAGEIWLVRVDGSAPRRRWPTRRRCSLLSSYTADGLGIVHSSNRGGATNIWFYPRRGGAPVRLTAGPGPDMTPTVAADGTIAFINSRWRNTLDVFSLRGVPARVLASHSPYMWGPSFSRDGKTIAFSRSEVDGSWHIWSIPVDGGTPRRLTRTPGGEVYSRFTPDRASVLFHTWGTSSHRPRSGRRRCSADARLRVGQRRVSGHVAGWPEIALTRTMPMRNGSIRARRRRRGAAAHRHPRGGGPVVTRRKAGSSLPGTAATAAGSSCSTSPPTARSGWSPTGGWPVWLPNGQEVGYLAVGRNGHQEIHTVSARGGGTSRALGLWRFNGTNHPFAISPDGMSIVASNSRHVSDEVWLLERPRH